MPKYVYECRKCGYTFEAILSVSERDKPLSGGCGCGSYDLFRHCGNSGGFRLKEGSVGWASEGYATTHGDAENFKASSQNMPKPY